MTTRPRAWIVFGLFAACIAAQNANAEGAVDKAPQASSAESLRLITAKELLTKMQSRIAPLVFDANSDDVRREKGYIRGANLLSAYDSFDIAKELPPAKSRALVFYCYNEQCMASHIAAERAKQAGYSDVSVMKNGIVGWTGAGYPIARIKSRR